MTIISDSFGRTAKPCLSPYLRISILLLDKVTFVRLVIRSLGLLCIPFWIYFSTIKLLNFLQCLIWISASLFDIKQLIENLMKKHFIQVVDSPNLDNGFCKSVRSYFIRLCLSLIAFWRFFWYSCYLIRNGLFFTCFHRTIVDKLFHSYICSKTLNQFLIFQLLTITFDK